jgi:hypothetical protein
MRPIAPHHLHSRPQMCGTQIAEPGSRALLCWEIPMGRDPGRTTKRCTSLLARERKWMNLCGGIGRGIQAAAHCVIAAWIVVFFDTISMAVRTPAGFPTGWPATGNSITSSANPIVKFTILRVWLVAMWVTGECPSWGAYERLSQS